MNSRAAPESQPITDNNQIKEQLKINKSISVRSNALENLKHPISYIIKSHLFTYLLFSIQWMAREPYSGNYSGNYSVHRADFSVNSFILFMALENILCCKKLNFLGITPSKSVLCKQKCILLFESYCFSNIVTSLIFYTNMLVLFPCFIFGTTDQAQV